MNLLTPPRTSHRGKENRAPSGSRVVWSQTNQIHSLVNAPPLVGPSFASALKEPPAKSILKKSSHVLLPLPDVFQKEVTPEPADPLTNSDYLESPVIAIIESQGTLPDLIAAYSILTARLRASVRMTTSADASWPLFHPLRKHQQAFIDAICRDLGRALVDPASLNSEPEEVCKEQVYFLPSPKETPRKKKGMSAEQVKFARDLCTTCHAAIRLLCVVFTLPPVFSVFTDAQLRALLTEVLAIPLANDLPTPNSRKTCALAIGVIQVQRLRAEVLLPTKDRIAYALRRGIEGELGKEGKKGPTSDGLKAVHDLCLCHPSIFVPAFAELLPSILSNLLAPALNLRTMACHALGGFVIGCTSIPSSAVHAHIASAVATFLTTPPTTSSKTPAKSSTDPAIIRTLRTTLGVTDPTHTAQGPVWALSVVASLIALLGPGLCADVNLTRVITALLSLSMRHKKSSVRALACLVWRCVAWAYFQPPFILSGEESEIEEGMDADAKETKLLAARENYWKVVKSVVDMGAGVSTIAALLGHESHSDADLKRALALMKSMIRRGGQTCADAMELAKNFVSFDRVEPQWDSGNLLPHGLFSAVPGLLTMEYKSLASVVRPIFEQCPQYDDVRSLTREELNRDWIFDGLVEIWRHGLRCLEMPEGAETPTEIIAIWDGLLKANVAALQDEGDDEGTANLAVRAATILRDILEDPFDLSVKGSSTDLTPTSPASDSSSPKSKSKSPAEPRSHAALILSVVRDLWRTTRTAIPHAQLGAAAELLLAHLIDTEDDLDDGVVTADPLDSRKEWGLLCAELLVVYDVGRLKDFWAHEESSVAGKVWNWTPEVRRLIWTSFVDVWSRSEEGCWEAGVALLAVPLSESETWDLGDDEFEKWDSLVQHTTTKALDYGCEADRTLNHIASIISETQSPTSLCSAHIADLLMSHLEFSEVREVPEALFELVNETLLSSYPPEPRNKLTTLWMIRSLTRLIDMCPVELSMTLLQIVQEGISTWISDAFKGITEDEYTFDILPLYHTSLLSIQALPHSSETLASLGGIIEAGFCGRDDKPQAISEAFVEFWGMSYGGMDEQGRWPAAIRRCLRCVGIAGDADTVEEALEEEDLGYEADTSFDDPSMEAGADVECEDEVEEKAPRPHLWASPLPGVPFTFSIKPQLRDGIDASPFSTLLAPALFTPPFAEEGEEGVAPNVVVFSKPKPEPPATPTRASRVKPSTCTPLRPYKPLSVFQSVPLRSPGSPLAASQSNTPKRSPVSRHGYGSAGRGGSGVHTLSAKRRKTVDKENLSPHSGVMSVAERIAMTSPGLGSSRKRVLWEDGDEGMSVSKKRKLGNVERSDRETAALPSTALRAQIKPSDRSAEVKESRCWSTASPRKRKGVFMDAVEVPTLREVRRRLLVRTVSLDSGSALTDDGFMGAEMGSASLATRRVVTFENGPALIPRRSYSEARGSRDVVSLLESGECCFLPMDASLVQESAPRPDDSIYQRESSPSKRCGELSSDDDPHVGQVTPHHLISPALRRVEECDPPSDDSVICASPTRDVVARRLQRIGA